MCVYESYISQSGTNTQLQRILVNQRFQSEKRTRSLHDVHQLFNLMEQFDDRSISSDVTEKKK